MTLALARTLYDIGDDLETIEALLLEVGGDVTNEQAEAAIDEWLQESQGELKWKVDRYVGLIRELQARADARNEEAERLHDRSTVDRNAADRLKARLKEFFERHDIKKLETDHFNVSVAKNGGKTPIQWMEWLDPHTLPDEFQLRVIDVDKEAVRAALEAGQNLFFAQLGQRGTNLRIK